MNEPQVSNDNINEGSRPRQEEPISNQSASMIILYFAFSVCLAIFTEDMQMKTLAYAIKIVLEFIAIFGLTFTQVKTMVLFE